MEAKMAIAKKPAPMKRTATLSCPFCGQELVATIALDLPHGVYLATMTYSQDKKGRWSCTESPTDVLTRLTKSKAKKKPAKKDRK